MILCSKERSQCNKLKNGYCYHESCLHLQTLKKMSTRKATAFCFCISSCLSQLYFKAFTRPGCRCSSHRGEAPPLPLCRVGTILIRKKMNGGQWQQTLYPIWYSPSITHNVFKDWILWVMTVAVCGKHSKVTSTLVWNSSVGSTLTQISSH